MKTRTERRAIVYSRVSTQGQATDGHGLDAQAAQGSAYVLSQGWGGAEQVVDAGVSGAVAPDERPGLGSALAKLDGGGADVLVAASLSRLGRRVLDVLALAERARDRGWGLVVLDVALDTTSPVGEFSLVVLAGVAQLERRMIGQRTRDGLAAAKRKGVRLGRPASAATRRAGRLALSLRADGATWQRCADVLAADGYRTATGKAAWTASQARRAARTVEQDRTAAAARRPAE